MKLLKVNQEAFVVSDNLSNKKTVMNWGKAPRQTSVPRYNLRSADVRRESTPAHRQQKLAARSAVTRP